MFKRLLFIAPSDSGLDVVPEIDALYEYGYTVQSLQGEVSRARLFEIARRNKFGVIHFACHSDLDGVELSKKERFDAPSIVQFAKMVGAVLVFLNGCETIEIGQLLIDEDIPAVICTLRRIDDQVAKETAQAFYKILAQRQDIRLAYHDSRPPIKGGYSLFTDGQIDIIQFGPIIERLDRIEQGFAKDQAEHEGFRASIQHVLTSCVDPKQQRRWFVGAVVVCVMVTTVVQSLITFIGRVPR